MIDLNEVVSRYGHVVDNPDSSLFDELIHELVAEELFNDQYVRGLQLKAVIDADGNPEKAKIVYARLRVEKLREHLVQVRRQYILACQRTADQAAENERIRAQRERERIQREKEEKARLEYEKNMRLLVTCPHCNSRTPKNSRICVACHLLMKF